MNTEEQQDEQIAKNVVLLKAIEDFSDAAFDAGVLTTEDYEICGMGTGEPPNDDMEVTRRRLIALLDRTCCKVKTWLERLEFGEVK